MDGFMHEDLALDETDTEGCCSSFSLPFFLSEGSVPLHGLI